MEGEGAGLCAGRWRTSPSPPDRACAGLRSRPVLSMKGFEGRPTPRQAGGSLSCELHKEAALRSSLPWRRAGPSQARAECGRLGEPGAAIRAGGSRFCVPLPRRFVPGLTGPGSPRPSLWLPVAYDNLAKQIFLKRSKHLSFSPYPIHPEFRDSQEVFSFFVTIYVFA